MALPTGTLTFLFSDIEGSTQLWENEPEAMRSMLALHDSALQEAIESNSGEVVKRTGDGFHAVFRDASSGAASAVAMQRICATTDWSTRRPIKVRIGLHTGESQLRDGDYYGPAVNRAARLMAAAHGGQIVCSASTGELAREGLGEGTRLVDLGQHRLRDLARSEQVFQVTHTELQRDFPDLRSIDTLPGNLPVQPNRFIGRHALVDEIGKRLATDRVVTLLGPGGVGKTRLALQVAAALQPEFEDGAWFVDLSAVTDDERVAAEVLETLDFLLAEGEDPVEGLCKRLRRRHLLLLLDNCEQVVAGVALVANAIAGSGSGSGSELRILATSREPLGIAAEQSLPIPPLDTGPDGDAVRLFTVRAKAARPNFALDDTIRDTVTELCQRLDGIPLAIELAAARSRSLAPAQILGRLDQRFRLLKSSDRTSAARHQTLQAAVDWSYELLSPQEQRVLDRLAIFAGGFTLDAAEAVVSDDNIDAFDVLDYLDALVDKSLVVVDDWPLGRRYRLLETIRQYATERLRDDGETEVLRARHAAHYRGFAEAAAPELFGGGEIEACDRLDADLDNLRAMLDWHLVQGEYATVAGIFTDIENYVIRRDHNLWAIARLDHCIDALSDDAGLVLAHCIRARFKSNCAHSGVSADIEAARSAAARAGVRLPLLALVSESTDLVVRGEAVRAYEIVDSIVEPARDHKDRRWWAEALSYSLIYRGLAHPGDPDLVECASQLRRDLESVWDSPFVRASYLLGAGLAHAWVDPAAGLRLFQEMHRLSTKMKSQGYLGDSAFFSSLLHLALDEPGQAAHSCRQALLRFQGVGHRRGLLMTLSGVVGIARKTGRAAEALCILAGLRRARRELDAPGSKNEQDAEARIARHFERELGEQALERAEASDLEGTIDLALALLDAVARDPKYAADAARNGAEASS